MLGACRLLIKLTCAALNRAKKYCRLLSSLLSDTVPRSHVHRTVIKIHATLFKPDLKETKTKGKSVTCIFKLTEHCVASDIP